MTKKPIIFHIDFDCYFVSAMRTIDPSLKNKPVAISRNTSHAVAISISYELKKLGCRTGMKAYEIKNIAPNAIFVPAQYEVFSALSNQIFHYLKTTYTQLIEVSSIDEVYLDVTDKVKDLNQALKLAKQIQLNVLKKFDIPISIGISHNKFLAKMTTNINKPFGLGLTTEADVERNFYSLDISEYHGIGRSLTPKLKEIGINTIGDFAKIEPDSPTIRELLGRINVPLINQLNPYRYERLSGVVADVKGIGNEITFENYDLDDMEIIQTLKNLTKKVVQRLQDNNQVCKTVTLTIRFRTKKWVQKQVSLNKFTDDYKEILWVAMRLYQKYYIESDIIGIGVRVSDLQSIFYSYNSLDLTKEQEKLNPINNLVGKINETFGKRVAYTLKDYDKVVRKQKMHKLDNLVGAVFRK
ncbi:Y-family DNA polymerase [Mycoplasma corogypsi]|uniref:Y-family DNA polymerase n=1 Tax=Mycoplasma corogypsi TaxID=2106 RepID=UPI0038733C6B